MDANINVKSNDRLISQITLEEYCNHLIDKIFNLLILKENNKDINKPIDKIIEELTGVTIYDIKPFIDNSYVLEILFIVSGLKSKMDFTLYRTIILDCCNLVSLLPERLIEININKGGKS